MILSLKRIPALVTPAVSLESRVPCGARPENKMPVAKSCRLNPEQLILVALIIHLQAPQVCVRKLFQVRNCRNFLKLF